MKQVEVELFYWEGCPSWPEARALLADVLAAAGAEASVRMHKVTSDEEAERIGFPGSPTIRIDGVDVDALGAGSRPALTCRIYHVGEGRISPVPSREMLEEAIK